MSDPNATDENWLLDEDEEEPRATGPAAPDQRLWRVLIVDDDVDVHAVTRLALRNVSFKGRELELFSAYSGKEAFEILRDTSDIALVLLDVVMETDDAGLILAKRIRADLNNSIVRVVLRTGQPGQAPEQRVIIEYDINDYKAKTELTTQKLFTTVISALRAYESLMMLERSRIGLGKILAGATNLYQIHSLREFASGVLNQVSAILDVGADGVLCLMQGGTGVPAVVAATGGYAALAESELMPSDHPLWPTIHKAFQEKRSQFEHPANVLFIHTEGDRELAISVTPPWPLAQIQRDLLEVFCQRIAAAFDNLYMFGQLRKAQEATVVALADLAEFRDSDTGGHVRRVQALSTAIAVTLKARGVYPDEVTPQLIDMIGLASILHDVGKVATPDSVLLKPGLHTDVERAQMQLHAQVGRTILERAANMVDGISYLSYGAQIAGGHHEHFDGAGYPAGLAGRAIPLAARIVAVVDVFDALLHERPYKEPWPYLAVRAYIEERSGTQFDPEAVAALAHLIDTEPALWHPDRQ
ncbi:response regulator RpfG family c-di-GMP phosphodiesterase [Oxalobacteraceae bacterium GrIS 1.11]